MRASIRDTSGRTPPIWHPDVIVGIQSQLFQSCVRSIVKCQQQVLSFAGKFDVPTGLKLREASSSRNCQLLSHVINLHNQFGKDIHSENAVVYLQILLLHRGCSFYRRALWPLSPLRAQSDWQFLLCVDHAMDSFLNNIYIYWHSTLCQIGMHDAQTLFTS